MKFRSLFLALPAVILLAGITRADVDLVRIWPGYRDAESFTSVAEYFGGADSKSNRIALRTNPAQRDGFYWLIRVKSDETITDGLIRLEVVRTGAIEPIVHEFPATVRAGSRAVSLGLTGADWSDSTEAPVAWRITLLSAEGEVLMTSSSFLWRPDPI